MIDICPTCQIATPCDCDEEIILMDEDYIDPSVTRKILDKYMQDQQDKLLTFVERLASMPMSHENLQSTWCPPEYDDIKDWWDQFIDEARNITGVSYRGK